MVEISQVATHLSRPLPVQRRNENGLHIPTNPMPFAPLPAPRNSRFARFDEHLRVPGS
jgi:hypothetical protein